MNMDLVTPEHVMGVESCPDQDNANYEILVIDAEKTLIILREIRLIINIIFSISHQGYM